MSKGGFCGLGGFFARIRQKLHKKRKQPEASQLQIVRLPMQLHDRRYLLITAQGSPYDFRRVVHFGSPGEDGSHTITINCNV